MTAVWKDCQLGDVLTLQRGFDITKAQQKPGSVPVVSSSGINSFHCEAMVAGPGVVIGRKGSLGTCFYLDGPHWPHDTTLWVKDFKGNDPKFCYYFLKGMDLAKFDVGSANPTLNRNHVHLLPVVAPDVVTQQRIAAILGAYDDLIEINRRRVALLEEMARGLFEEWFVRFRFPDSDKGERSRSTERWQKTSLEAHLHVDKGVSYKGSGLTAEGNPMVNLKNIIPGGGFRRGATKPYSGDFKDRHIVNSGDVVVANTDLTQAANVIASPALIPSFLEERPILISHHLYAVRPLNGMQPLFLYHLMLTDAFRGFAKGFANGTTVLGLPKRGILNFTFDCPPESLIRDFVGHVKPMHDVMEMYHSQNENLTASRDLLLPRLISGQLSVEAAERQLEDAA